MVLGAKVLPLYQKFLRVFLMTCFPVSETAVVCLHGGWLGQDGGWHEGRKDGLDCGEFSS